MLFNRTVPLKPERVFILGCGVFGSSAAFKVESNWPDCEIHVVDILSELPSAVPGEKHPGMDAVRFLRSALKKERPDDLVIPCVPEHVAFNWVLSHFGYCIPVPVRLMETFPGAIAGRDGCIYSSLSNFRCPSDCSEPADSCMVTGRKREKSLFDIFESISLHSYRNIVVRSHQLLPGVGAFTSGVLFSMLAEVRKDRGRFLVSTASRCHGVVHGFVH